MSGGDTDRLRRRRLRVRGVVQGVGFRPFVHRLAGLLGLTGEVFNDGAGVLIEVQGAERDLDGFTRRLTGEAPPLARITAVESGELPPRPGESKFRIRLSGGGPASTGVPPDAAVCDACLGELFDPADRRHRYAFVNCTHCGPRYTLTAALPYDRPQTSMAAFAMCARCQAEYDDPADRRFHAQPNACPACGPRLALLGPVGRPVEADDPLEASLDALRQGRIVALKGLGGFHLACDARNAESVAALRERKQREEKPLAVMAAGCSSLAALAEYDSAEQALLESVERPIVLLRKRAGCDAVLPGVAPGVAWLGAMLPYTPLHYLLFHEAAGRPVGTLWTDRPQPLLLVMTSANPGGEPLVTDNDEAVRRLGGIADLLLVHDREILVRCDDSVLRARERPVRHGGPADLAGAPLPPTHSGGPADLAGAPLPPDRAPAVRKETRGGDGVSGAAGDAAAGRESLSPRGREEAARSGRGGGLAFVRRARGYTPRSIPLARRGPRVLALGGWFKNTVCATREQEAFVSQHVGDLDDAATCGALGQTVEHLLRVLQIEPERVACDLHPDFHSTRLAERIAEERELPLIRVQHHHAHAAAVAAEHGLEGPLLALCLDGVGLGTDGAAWGGELLAVDGARFERLGHLRRLPLPGGDRAAREPWRMAAAVLCALGREEEIPRRFRQPAAEGLAEIVRRGVNCPETSSAGRWFDAAAALLGVREVHAFEGQAPMLLEGLAESWGPAPPLADGFRVGEDGELDFLPLLAALADEPDAGRGAALFHATLAAALEEWAGQAAERTGRRRLVLGGGCFLNHLLSRTLVDTLRERGVEVFEAGQLPPNDGGLSLGQAAVARASEEP